MVKENIFKLRIKTCNGLYKVFKNNKLKKHYHNIIEQYVTKEIPNTIKKYKQVKKEKNLKDDKKYIWIFWWQGLEKAPEIVKICIGRIKKINADCEVIVLSKDNYKKYVDLSDNIEKKFEEGKIGIAHFSDVLRVNLLQKFGGLWMDSTIYETKKIEDKIFFSDYWSIKNKESNIKFVSKNRWTTYFLRMKKNNILANFLVDAFNEYYKNNDKVCHYLFFDYLIDIAYNNCKEIKQMIDDNPINNCECESLRDKLNEQYNQNIENILNDSETYFFKLTYKINFSKEKETLYNKKIREDII